MVRTRRVSHCRFFSATNDQYTHKDFSCRRSLQIIIGYLYWSFLQLFRFSWRLGRVQSISESWRAKTHEIAQDWAVIHRRNERDDARVRQWNIDVVIGGECLGQWENQSACVSTLSMINNAWNVRIDCLGRRKLLDVFDPVELWVDCLTGKRWPSAWSTLVWFAAIRERRSWPLRIWMAPPVATSSWSPVEWRRDPWSTITPSWPGWVNGLLLRPSFRRCARRRPSDKPG